MKQITCVTCPICCRITVDIENGEYQFSGNKCIKGAMFAAAEMNAPIKSLKTMVRTVFPDIPVLPVMTDREVPEKKVKKIIRELSKIVITKRLGFGDKVACNILKTGCDAIAASDMLLEVS